MDIFDIITDSFRSGLNNNPRDCYIKNPETFKVGAIKDIKQNGPATIIFLTNGDKVVVKCQEGICHDRLGLYMCLVKYLVGNGRRYTDCIDYIFNYIKKLDKRFLAAEAMIISHIGEHDFTKILDKFYGYKED